MNRLYIIIAAIFVASVPLSGEAMAGSTACKDKLGCQSSQKACTARTPADTGANRADTNKACALAPKKRAQKSAPEAARQTPEEPEILEEEEEEEGDGET